MKNKHIKKITAVTRVFFEGQKCIRAVLEYDTVILNSSVSDSVFRVGGRTVTAAYASPEENGKPGDGRFVILELFPEEQGALTYIGGNPWEGRGAQVIKPQLSVEQAESLRGQSGEDIPAAAADVSNMVLNELTDDFVQGSFEGLAYNLYIPKDYNPEKSYPLVQFIHDASVCGKQPECTLAQGVGALIWITQKAQEKHPCFVLAPQYDIPSIVDDDWNVDHRLEVGKRLLDKIVKEYHIDADRLYTTGQSMGCMASMVLNLRYPDLFAASLFVAGQWDERLFSGSGLEKKNFWFINSMGDAKAFPGMNQILVGLERDGAGIAREIWDAKASNEELAAKAEKLIATGANMFYTPYAIESVADGWHSDGGEHHVNTWRYAYCVDAIREWLFAQKKS